MSKLKHVAMITGGTPTGQRNSQPQVWGNIALRPENDLIAPAVSFIVVSGNPIVIQFSKELDPNFTPATTDFTVLKNTVATTVSSVTVVGSTVKLTMSVAIVGSDTVTVAYTKPTANVRLRDLDGNEVASFTATTVLNYTTTVDTTIPHIATRRINGSTLVLIYDESLNTTAPASSTHVVKFNSTTQTISSIAITGSTVTIVLAAPAIITDAVTVAYTANATNDLQDLSGNKAVNYGDTAVVNTTTPATTYDSILSGRTKISVWDSFLGTNGTIAGNEHYSASHVGATTPVFAQHATLGVTYGRLGQNVDTLNDYNFIQFSSTFSPYSAEDWSFKCLLGEITAPTVGAGHIYYMVGFLSASVATAGGIYFRSIDDGNWFLVCRSAGVETTRDLGVAPSATRQLLEFRISGTGTSVQAYVANIPTGAPITTNIPTATNDVKALVIVTATVGAAGELGLFGWGLQAA